MEGHRIYNYEQDVLIRQTMPNGGKYLPVLDKFGDYFIFEKEHEHCGLGQKMEYQEPTEALPE